MGAWGTGILSDDTVRDVRGDYFDLFNRGLTAGEIRERILQEYRTSIKDPDEGPLIWIGVAKAQWDCRHLEPIVFSKIKEIVDDGLGLDLWAEQGESLLKRRKDVLSQFLSHIQAVNPRPRKPRKAIKRKAIFQPGDCLAVRYPDGDWGAILILHSPPESNDPYKNTYGVNLAARLSYEDSAPPGLEVFQKREWRKQQHWPGSDEICNVVSAKFRRVRDRFVLVGNVPLRSTDPTQGKVYCAWPAMATR